MELGTRGPLGAPCTACAASAMAVGEGYDAIRLGRAEVMLCGGSEAGITELAVAGFAAMRALSRRNGDPAGASRPFDADRDGFVMGEGAAVLVLEELEHARARGAKVYAELAGYGVSSDSFHMTEPDPLGAGQARAVEAALADAALDPTDVDYVNAHASSTGLGDAIETRALKLALGETSLVATGLRNERRDGSLPWSRGCCRTAFMSSRSTATSCRQRSTTRRLIPLVNHCVPNNAGSYPSASLSNSFGFGVTTLPSSCASLSTGWNPQRMTRVAGSASTSSVLDAAPKMVWGPRPSLCSTHRSVHRFPVRAETSSKARAIMQGRCLQAFDDPLDFSQARLEGVDLLPKAVQFLGKDFAFAAFGSHDGESDSMGCYPSSMSSTRFASRWNGRRTAMTSPISR